MVPSGCWTLDLLLAALSKEGRAQACRRLGQKPEGRAQENHAVVGWYPKVGQCAYRGSPKVEHEKASPNFALLLSWSSFALSQNCALDDALTTQRWRVHRSEHPPFRC